MDLGYLSNFIISGNAVWKPNLSVLANNPIYDYLLQLIRLLSLLFSFLKLFYRRDLYIQLSG